MDFNANSFPSSFYPLDSHTRTHTHTLEAGGKIPQSTNASNKSADECRPIVEWVIEQIQEAE